MAEAGLASLVVVTYNSAAALPGFLASLADAPGAPYELIAVDNASRDGSAELLRQAGVALVANAENLGFGRACNQGAARARGDLLVFLNPDLTFTPGWLAALRAALDADATVGLAGPHMPYPGEPAAPGPAQAEVAALSGSALAIRRAAWDQLGGFDPQIFLYWEDVDLCWRAWLAGWRVVRDGRSVVYHARGGSGGGRGWDGEAMRAGIYVHLKLMRWRAALPYLLRQALAAPAKALLGRPGVLAAWGWNLRRLGATLAQRRAIARARRIDPRRLEALAARHRYAGRRT